MNVTKAQVEALKARRDAAERSPIKEGWDNGVLSVFVFGRPTHPLNGTLAHAHWSKRAKWAKGWRERAAAALLHWVTAQCTPALGPHHPWLGRPDTSKTVTFTVCGPSRFDDDNLRAVCKPVRDALKDMRVIDDDRPSAGHTFEYRQEKPTRRAGAVHGIAIKIELA